MNELFCFCKGKILIIPLHIRNWKTLIVEFNIFILVSWNRASFFSYFFIIHISEHLLWLWGYLLMRLIMEVNALIFVFKDKFFKSSLIIDCGLRELRNNCIMIKCLIQVHCATHTSLNWVFKIMLFYLKVGLFSIFNMACLQILYIFYDKLLSITVSSWEAGIVVRSALWLYKSLIITHDSLLPGMSTINSLSIPQGSYKWISTTVNAAHGMTEARLWYTT